MKASNALYLIVGAGVGFLVGVYTSKEKYKKIADEEIKSVIEEFRGMRNSAETKNEERSEETVIDKSEAIRKNYAKSFEPDEKPQKKSNIEIIDDAEFGEAEDENGIPYVTETLFYYEDGALADSDNELADETIIDTALLSANNWNGDSMYFRNHTLKMDIEVLKAEQRFKDIKEKEQYYEEE